MNEAESLIQKVINQGGQYCGNCGGWRLLIHFESGPPEDED